MHYKVLLDSKALLNIGLLPNTGPECFVNLFLTWFVGSQGTERGMSLCLQEMMYFLKQQSKSNKKNL